MPPKAPEAAQADDNENGRPFFRVPAPIKHLFDKFPLTTYPANDLPQHSLSHQTSNRLFVFTDTAAARRGRPSFNPQCLKWQVRPTETLIWKSEKAY